MLHRVEVSPRPLTAYQPLISGAVLREINHPAASLRGRRVVHINATPRTTGPNAWPNTPSASPRRASSGSAIRTEARRIGGGATVQPLAAWLACPRGREGGDDALREQANAAQRLRVRHAAVVEGPRDSREPERLAPVLDRLHAAGGIADDHVPVS